MQDVVFALEAGRIDRKQVVSRGENAALQSDLWNYTDAVFDELNNLTVEQRAIRIIGYYVETLGISLEVLTSGCTH